MLNRIFSSSVTALKATDGSKFKTLPCISATFGWIAASSKLALSVGCSIHAGVCCVCATARSSCMSVQPMNRHWSTTAQTGLHVQSKRTRTESRSTLPIHTHSTNTINWRVLMASNMHKIQKTSVTINRSWYCSTSKSSQEFSTERLVRKKAFFGQISRWNCSDLQTCQLLYFRETIAACGTLYIRTFIATKDRLVLKRWPCQLQVRLKGAMWGIDLWWGNVSVSSFELELVL